MKKYLKFIIVFSVLVILLIFIEITRSKEIDWSLSFSKDDKIPYGSLIIYDVLYELFPEDEIYYAEYPIYNILKEEYPDIEELPDTGISIKASPALEEEILYNYDIENESDIIDNYIFINNNFSPDELDIKKLLAYVKEGNNVFVSANTFSGKFSDTLNFSSNYFFSTGDSVGLNFINKKLNKKEDYFYKTPTIKYSFIIEDTINTVVLGYANDSLPNFIKIKYGEGYFYLNSFPLAFTNYYMLNPATTDYVYKALSYLPENSSILWDEYYKSNKAFMRTPLSFILSQKALSSAYYLILISIILYIIFAGRRRQRIIPVKRKLANTTLEFVKTIGRLYYQQKNHKNISDKKISYFLEQLRNKFNIRTDEINEEILNKISQKSGVKLREVKAIFNYINHLDLKLKIKEEELKKINNLIESFYRKAGIYGRTN